MTRLPAVVIAGPGTNRDPDAALALRLAGADPEVVLLSELPDRAAVVGDARLIVVAGGFSYADALGAGRMMALELTARAGDLLSAHVDAGRPLLGICNGFQVLTRAGLLPGALGHNDHGRFDCRWVGLDPEPGSVCVWTSTLTERLDCPIAHGEGRFVHPDAQRLAADGQVALRYTRNPNGSVADIAGVCDPTGVVLGLMPHPENHVLARQHPQHRRRSLARESSDGRNLGLALFAAGVVFARGAT